MAKNKREIIKEVNHEGKINAADYLKGIGIISKGIGFSAFGEITFIILSFITEIIITQVVGAKIYGVYLLANTVISILMIFSLFGLNNGLIRYIALYKAKNDSSRIKGTILSALLIAVLLSLVFALVTFSMANTIAINIFHDLHVSLAIRILIFSLPFLAVTIVFDSTINGFQKIKDLVLVKYILKPVVRLIFLIILFLLGFKLMGLLLASVIDSIILAFIAYFILIKIFPFTNPRIGAIFQIKELIDFSWPLFLTNSLNFFIGWTDILMLGFFLSTREVGIYGVMHKATTFVSLPLTMINTVFVPLIAELHTKGDFKRLEEYFKLMAKWAFTASLPIFIILIFLVVEIYKFFILYF